MVCFGCLMVEDLPQWLLDLHLGPPSPSSLAMLVSGSWSFSERDGVLSHIHCWLDLPHMLLWPSTCSVHVTVHILYWWDLLHSLLIWPSMFTVDGTFHLLYWWGPSTCNVNGTFYMQCWWDLLCSLLMGPSTCNVDGTFHILCWCGEEICSMQLQADFW